MGAVAFSRDGKLLASADCEDGTVQLWDLERVDAQPTLTGWVNALAFSPDGKLLASGDGDGTGRWWDIERG